MTRDDIQILLAEHLKTIERIQQVKDAGKLDTKEPGLASNINRGFASDKNSPGEHLKRPESASKLRKLNSGKKASSVLKSTLPPIDKSKGGKSERTKLSQDLDGVPGRERSDSVETIKESPESSPDSTAKNRNNFNESGIESDPDTSDAMLVNIAHDCFIFLSSIYQRRGIENC